MLPIQDIKIKEETRFNFILRDEKLVTKFILGGHVKIPRKMNDFTGF
ncbi:hypothetical protein LINGRAHAP2_LOCUS20526 [Linum grandiflorum]